MTDFRTIQYERDGRAARITLQRPEVLNAIDPTLEEIGGAVALAQDEADVSALIITDAGDRAFCAGMDLRAFQKGASTIDPFAARGARRGYRHPLAAMSKPIIGAVNGLAYGGGLEIVLLCDVVVVSEHATFAASEVSRGLIPGNGATQRLPRKIGLTVALEMLLTGRPIDAQRAVQIGLANAVVPASELLPRVRLIAGAIAENGPVAVKLARRRHSEDSTCRSMKGSSWRAIFSRSFRAPRTRKKAFAPLLRSERPNWSGK